MKIKEFTRILSLTVVFTLLAGCGKDKVIPQKMSGKMSTDMMTDHMTTDRMIMSMKIMRSPTIFSRYKRQQKLPEISTINSFA